MIANICAFLSCFFVIAIKIKTIESAGNSQVNPIRFFVKKTDENYSRIVNSVKTFKDRPIVLNSADQTILSTGYNTIKEYRLKLNSRDKLEKKGKEIKCSFFVIVKSNILCLKNLDELLKNGERIIYNENLRCLKNYQTTENTMIHLKLEAELIIRLLLAENLETDIWLWSYFLKIIATRHYNKNKNFIRENPFDDDQLQTGVSELIRNCIAEKYLPPTAMESDFVSKNMNIYNNMFTELCNSEYYRSFIENSLERDYDIMIELLYLKPFWEDESQLLFGQIAHANVDWSKAKRRHEVEVVISRKFMQKRTWIYTPYGRLDHQLLLIKIIDARFYCYISVILHVYEKQLFSLGEPVRNHLKNMIYKVIKKALKLTASKDEFLVMVVSELQLAKTSNADDIKYILTIVRAKANEMLNGLNGAYTNEIDWLSINFDEHQLAQLPKSVLIMRTITNFEDYLNELSSICLPFAYKTLLYFMDIVKLRAARYI